MEKLNEEVIIAGGIIADGHLPGGRKRFPACSRARDYADVWRRPDRTREPWTEEVLQTRIKEKVVWKREATVNGFLLRSYSFYPLT